MLGTVNFGLFKSAKKHLSFSALKQAISLHFHAIKDSRVQGKCDYSQHDVLMSALPACIFKIPL